ncbi:MAG: hypothetical protein CFH41_02806 [Alphaproteobacteria bacterium MarineAlpha11_Bin1]|nr:MAG: hypothetical protein CFH41_02806 [Alphaproteobacteria bacterium MarineAlpha11_Bin1]
MKEHDLHATWDLQRFWFTDDSGVEVEPLGTDAVGSLILSADRQYAFTMMRSGRTSYRSGDLLGGTSDEKSEAAGGYVSFGGSWSFDGEAIIFGINYSLFPNWVGAQQKRIASFSGDELLLQTIGAILMAGKSHHGAARWRRK